MLICALLSADDETTEERTKKTLEKKSKRALSSAMLREMREQFTDAPMEITVRIGVHILHLSMSYWDPSGM